MEVELLLFREKLEDKGLSKADVEQQVTEEREKLLSSSSNAASTAEPPSTSNRYMPISIV